MEETMSTRINTNTAAFEAARNLSINSDKENKNIQRLSSGLRINSAADDAAGLVISNSLQAQVAGLNQANKNTNDAINLVKTAEGALNEVSSLLTNIRQLVIHAANVGVNDKTALTADQQEIQQAVNSINRIAKTTQFNNKNLLAGDGTGAISTGTGTAAGGSQSLTFQIGSNGGQTVSVSVGDESSYAIGKAASYTKADGTSGSLSGVSLSQLGGTGTPTLDLTNTATNGDAAQQALAIVDQAIADISSTRASLGSVQKNQLESNTRSLSVAQQNLSASESSIRDTDLSAEIVDYTKNQILVQAGTSALAQANSAPQAILKLLQ